MFGIILDSNEFQLSKEIVNFWAQFAAFGNPNGDGTSKKVKHARSPVQTWPAYNSTNANATIFDLDLNLGVTTDVWGYACEQLEQLIFFNSSLPF